MKEALYKKLAGKITAYHNCVESHNAVWEGQHREDIERLTESYMPSGSGIDAGTSFDFDKSKTDKLVFNSSYHTMDDCGFYGRWIEFTVTVTPSLEQRYYLNIKGNFGKDHDIKDYLYDVFGCALDSIV